MNGQYAVGLGGRGEERRERGVGRGGRGGELKLELKTLILKDSSVRSIWTYLTASPCYTTNTNRQKGKQTGRQTGRQTDRQKWQANRQAD